MLNGARGETKRWPRGQRFTLSPTGTEAERAYRAAVLGARASGRAVLDSALSAWATPRGISPADGVLLAELSGKCVGVAALCEAVEPAGIVPDEVRAAIARLVAAGIVDPVPPPSRQLS